MIAPKWLYKLGAYLAKSLPATENGELETLRQEIIRLRAELQTFKISETNSTKQEIEILRSDLQGSGEREVILLKQEIDILRNEVLDNIAAINRLEILTLKDRIDLLHEFGKALPPTFAGRTKESFKPLGFSFGIITNGKRNEKLARLVETIRLQDLAADQYEILVAGCVDGIPDCADIRKFYMDQAAAEGRLGAMRNVLAKAASFNKFVCLDDDFLLHPRWAEGVLAVDGDFDLATGIILNPDLSRYCDWVSLIENYTFLRAYHEMFDKCQYMTGGYGIYKDYVFVDQYWDDHLGFYQGEDVSFSKRLFNAGYQLKFIPKAIVMHDDDRYSQKGYGVIRTQAYEEANGSSPITLRMEKLCPRTLS
ncbi:MAG: hypothetical protein HY912_23580 [Desulfomonile tiedjei]|uniref:Glycosyltransferase n=1 Tax=Desulfomonile tiedjei TaxID=2358 RepID=A0A9D6VBP5_9BACT|nr:hypothetical protein [Desulfomonile tiedjei]